MGNDIDRAVTVAVDVLESFSVSTVIVRGKEVSIAHLAPLTFCCPCMDPSVTRPIRIEASFSNHCYASAFDPAVDQRTNIIIYDRNHAGRVFDAVRHELSLRLPLIIASLPGAKVHQTSARRNYVFATLIDVPAASTALSDLMPAVPVVVPKIRYEIFFTIRRPEQKGAHDLRLFVESAYPPHAKPTVLPRRPSAIKFNTLATKVLLGQSIKFAARG